MNTGKRIEDNLKRHYARMQELITQGMPKDEASKQAYKEITDNNPSQRGSRKAARSIIAIGLRKGIAKMTTSWKPEVQTDDSGKWYGNALRFATREEALGSAGALMSRWYAVVDYRATESDDPVNYKHVNGRDIRLEIGDYASLSEHTLKPDIDIDLAGPALLRKHGL